MTDQAPAAEAPQQQATEQQAPTEPPQAAAAPSAIDAHSAGSTERFSEAQQAKVNQIVQDRLAEQQRKHDAEIAEAAERAGKSELDAAKLDVEKYQQLAEQARTEARAEILNARVYAAIAGSDTRKDRRDAVARLVDREGLDALTGPEQAEQVTARIAAVLDEYPEWKQTSVPGTAGGPTPAPQTGLTLAQWRGMGIDARTKVYREHPGEFQRLTAEEQAAG
ncbi:hypothetical protein [Cumulibacter soli]|uniref:hypothetical protein n=1 Tax=Cumulibacter soli TaxID=2546344 RepID=UPI0010672F94|nr:hypothetical protein [Cumulibacter soli]